MFRTEAELEDALSEPSPAAVEALAACPGDIVVLGAAGKMGPSLTRMAKRAADAAGGKRRVIAVSRFSGGGEDAFRAHGIDTVRCDLLNEAEVMNLPDAPNVVYMPAKKFGSTGDEATTWAMNSYLPGLVCKKYRSSRIVAFSTGNVYPLSPVTGRGPKETDAPNPVGEYGMSALGRERMFEYFSRTWGIPVAVIRLNYACDLRYGVPVEIARKVFAGEPVDVTMGHFNTIWQGDANAMTLAAFSHCAVPPRPFNVTGPEVLSVRAVAGRFGEQMNKPVRVTGTEAGTALLSDGAATIPLLGPIRVPTSELLGWVAEWVSGGGRLLNKPSHYQTRDGKF